MEYLIDSTALTRAVKRSKEAEKNGLWSLSKTNTWDGGHRLIIESCCSGFRTRSCIVLMYTRGILTLPSSSPPSIPRVKGLVGPGLSSIEASMESWSSENTKLFNSVNHVVNFDTYVLYALVSSIYLYIYSMHIHVELIVFGWAWWSMDN